MPFRFAVALLILALAPVTAHAQPAGPGPLANQQQARRVLDSAIRALGGAAWLNVHSIQRSGHASALYEGRPSGPIVAFFETIQPPDKERIAFTKKKNVVQIFDGRQGWEITYKGKHALPQDRLAEHLRRHDHSLRVVLQQWCMGPQTALFYDGPSQVERHLADKVTLFNKDHDSVTLEMDSDSHLPLRATWKWRDPQFHDLDQDAVEYDNYHRVDGIATPLTLTYFHNGEMTRVRYFDQVRYNVPVSEGAFDPSKTALQLR